MADTLHEKSRVLGVNNSTKVTQRGRGGPGLGPGCLRLPGPLGNNVRPGPQEGGAVPKSLESRSVSHLPICWLLQLGPYVTTTPVQAHFLLRKGCDTPVVAGRGGKGQGGPWGCEGGGSEAPRSGAGEPARPARGRRRVSAPSARRRLGLCRRLGLGQCWDRGSARESFFFFFF